MIEEEEALRLVLGAVPTPRAERVALKDALGRWVLGAVRAEVASPPFVSSSMDGYALRAEDAGEWLELVGEQPAGKDRLLSVRAGEAVRIFTGAPLPMGADAVFMQEDAEVAGSQVRVEEQIEIGQYVRPAGGDLCVGQTILRGGERLNSARLGLLAGQGRTEVQVGVRPRVWVLGTGDELIEPGGELAAGEIFNSNTTMLSSLVAEVGGELVGCGHAADTAAALRSEMLRGLAEADALVLSGGVSVGDYDYVREVLSDLGMEPSIWRVRVKPGKPFLLAVGGRGEHAGKIVFGLPGNPVSSFVTFQIFVRPALEKWMGAKRPGLPTCAAILSETVRNEGDRPHYLRGNVGDPDKNFALFSPVEGQLSHASFGLSLANGLLRVPAETEFLAGELAEILRF